MNKNAKAGHPRKGRSLLLPGLLPGLLLGLILTLLLPLTGCSKLTSDQKKIFTEAQTVLDGRFGQLRTAMEAAADEVGTEPAGSLRGYNILNRTLRDLDFCYDLLAVDGECRVRNVGTTLDQGWIGSLPQGLMKDSALFGSEPRMLLRTGGEEPLLWCSFPVDKGGWILACVDPIALGQPLQGLTSGNPVGLGLISLNGEHLYSDNFQEIGLNILNDDLYAGFGELLDLVGGRLLKEKQGSGDYSFYQDASGGKVRKHLEWTTVKAFGEELRLYVNTEPDVTVSAEESGYRAFSPDELGWFSQGTATVTELFGEIEALGASAVEAWSLHGAGSVEFGKALEAVAGNPAVGKALYLGTDGTVLSALPSSFPGEGWAASIREALPASGRPVLVEVRSPDHPGAMNLSLAAAFPLVQDGRTQGWVVGVVRAYRLDAALAGLSSLGRGVNFWLADGDGTIVYDGDLAEVGFNLLEDSLYLDAADFAAFVHEELLAKSSGESEYTFYAAGMKREIRKRVVWTTLPVLGSDFRFAMNTEEVEITSEW